MSESVGMRCVSTVGGSRARGGSQWHSWSPEAGIRSSQTTQATVSQSLSSSSLHQDRCKRSHQTRQLFTKKKKEKKKKRKNKRTKKMRKVKNLHEMRKKKRERERGKDLQAHHPSTLQESSCKHQADVFAQLVQLALHSGGSSLANAHEFAE